jgi:Na+/H+ antiporter NhaB
MINSTSLNEVNYKQYKIHGYVFCKKATTSDVNLATRFRLDKCVQLDTLLAENMARCLCLGNSLVCRNVGLIPVECLTLACIIACLDHEHTQNKAFFDSYPAIPVAQLAESFIATYKDIPWFQPAGNVTPLLQTLDSIRTMGSNALEYFKNL